MKCGVCNKEATKGGYCQECFETHKVGKMVGRPVLPNGRCHICGCDVAEREVFCEECTNYNGSKDHA